MICEMTRGKVWWRTMKTIVFVSELSVLIAAPWKFDFYKTIPCSLSVRSLFVLRTSNFRGQPSAGIFSTETRYFLNTNTAANGNN